MQSHGTPAHDQGQAYLYEDPLRRLNLSLNLFWLTEGIEEGSPHLPSPEIIAGKIAADLESSLEQFAARAANNPK